MVATTKDAPRLASTPPKKRRRLLWRIARWGFIVLVLLIIAGRLYLPVIVRDYVNKTLDQTQVFRGKIGDIDINLWRGAYAIHDIRLVKVTGDVPVPLFSSPRVEFAIQWDAILHGKIVGQFVVEHPEINFVDAPSGGEAQSGTGGPWLQIIRDLFPFTINSAVVHDGSVHFRTYQAAAPVDVYLDHLEVSIDNLTNVRDETTPLLSNVEVHGLAMDEATFEFKMRFDPFSYNPTFHMGMRLIGLDVTKINDLALAYGKFDFKRGYFDLVVELDDREGLGTGYIKPLFRSLQIFKFPQDLREDNPLQFFWQALVGGTARVLTNQPRDQFGTVIPVKVNEQANTPDILATIGNVLRNAFIRAYLPKLQNNYTPDGSIEFEPPDITAPVSVGDQSEK